MRKSLGYLPKDKQAELELITEAILANIPDIRMIILFGSYARGQQIEDIHIEGHTTHVYESDFDILVATKTKKQAESPNLCDKIQKAIETTKKVKTPCNIIYHSFGYVKQMITDGHYFFTDIKKEGRQLYRKASKFSFTKIKILTPEERKQIAQEHFKQWFKNAKDFYTSFEFNLNRRKNKLAAFELHQATERFYSAITLVFINYRYRSHDIEMLDKKAVEYNPDFAKAFPRETKEQIKAFKLLKKAYVDARYKPEYRITKKQLEYLAKQVKKLQRLTKKLCTQKIESFK